jgi:hypothetical protein
MKKLQFKKSFWQSTFSIFALSVFIYFALGSAIAFDYASRTKYLGNGVYRTRTKCHGSIIQTTGKQDEEGRWKGSVQIKTSYLFGSRSFVENATFFHGFRHGESIITKDGMNYRSCYDMGQRIPCNKSANKVAADSSAFQILRYNYPWFMFTLNAFGYNDDYIEAYLDTVELELNAIEFKYNKDDFFNNYSDILKALEETPYDSIIKTNYLLRMSLALDFDMKNAEFRLAAIDRYRSGSGTYNILQTSYPGYVQGLNEAEVSNSDLETFCKEFDDILESYGPLDPEDPFFVDSVDSKVYQALDSITSAEKSASVVTALKSQVIYNLRNNSENYIDITNPHIKQLLLDLPLKNIATTIVLSFFPYLVYSDLILNSVEDAYKMKNGILSLPTVTTGFSENNSATSATINGSVIEDGRSSVTNKGIVWADFYNPTINNNMETRGNGTLPFSATIEGLTEGKTYYARAFATNSVGTGYGNCVKFVAKNTTGIDDNNISELGFNIFPNPVSATATFSFQLKQSESLVLTIVDLNGKVIIEKELSNLNIGKNEVLLNLSNIQNGIYNCLLTNNSTIKVNRKLLIAR